MGGAYLTRTWLCLPSWTPGTKERFPGYSVHEELELMVEAGLTPARALEAATTGGASLLGKESSLGRSDS